MDRRLLDEMAGEDVPPSPAASKARAEDKMWEELGKDEGSDEDESVPTRGPASKYSSRSSNNGNSKNKNTNAGQIAQGRVSRPTRPESKRGPSNFRWTEKGDREPDVGDSNYFAFDDDDVENDGGGSRPGNQSPRDGPLRIGDLDVFYTHVYTFFKEKGLWCMITSRLVNLVNLGFTIFFSTFLFLFVDWASLSVCGEAEVGCGNFSEYIDWGLEKSAFTFWQGVVVFYFCTFCVFWIWTLYSFFPVLKVALEMDKFYKNRLQISTRQLQTMPWNDVVVRLAALHKRHRIQLNKAEITAHDIACRIMRRENYLIAMYNQQIFNLRVPGIYQIKNKLYRQAQRAAAIARRKATTYGWLGGVSSAGALGVHGDSSSSSSSNSGPGAAYAMPQHDAEAEEINIPHTRGFFLTNHLQWNIEFCVMNHMFDRTKALDANFVNGPGKLQQRFVLVGIANFVLMPFTLIFMIVYFFMRHAEALHNNKEYLGPREWSPHAKWLFREFNELPHFFEERLNLSYESADKYDKQFATPLLSIVARCVSYITGGMVALLAILALIDDDILLQVTVFDRNLLWYTAVFGGTLAIARTFISEREKSVLDPNAAMRSLVKHTHYMDEKWRGRCHTYDVRDNFLQLYRFKLELFCMELISVVFSPLILCFSLPKSAHRIVNFIDTFSVDTSKEEGGGQGAGHVLGYSLFDFARFGDAKYGAPQDGPRDVQLAQGKLEKSFLSFKQNHPTWEPDAMGRSVIDTLNRFRSRALGVTNEIDSSGSSDERGSGSTTASSSVAGGASSNRFSRDEGRHQHKHNHQGQQRQQQDMEGSIFFVKRTETATGEILPVDKQPNAFYWLDKFNESRAKARAAREWRKLRVASAVAHSSSHSASLTASILAQQRQDQFHQYQQPMQHQRINMNTAGGMNVGEAETEMADLSTHRVQHHTDFGNPHEPLPRAVTTGEYVMAGNAAEVQLHNEMLRGDEHSDALDDAPPSLPHAARGFPDPTSRAAVSLSREFQEAEGHESQVEDLDLDLPEEFV